jgi:glycosyltransferase involved in cell wall biosynthesis
MNTPFFSIIIPTYNRANLLKEAIISVLHQTYTDWELIVVDDGSTDESVTIVKSFMEKRIHYYFQKNQGKSVARNLGIEMAKGSYICFLDSDDYFLSHHLESIRERIAFVGKTAVYGAGLIMSGDSPKKEKRTKFFYPEKGFNLIEFFLLLYGGSNMLNPLAFPSEALRQHRFDLRWKYFQDTHLTLRILTYYPFYQIKDYSCVCRNHKHRSSYTLFADLEAESLTENNVGAIKDLIDNYLLTSSLWVSSNIRDYLVSSKYMDHASGYLAVGKYRLAWKFLIKAIRYDKKLRGLIRYLKFIPKFPLKFLFDYPSLPNNDA